MSPNISLSLKALRDLGPEQAGLYAWYKFGLKTGHYRRAVQPPAPVNCSLHAERWPLPTREAVQALLGEAGQRALFAEADEIAAGRVRLFGGPPVDLQLAPQDARAHWTDYETGKARHDGDFKLTWEPARFGWATVLARAFYVSRAEKYAEAFWNQLETFLAANPPYYGPNWVSAQESALRILAWTFSWSLLREAESTTPARSETLAQAMAVHAARIPATLVYARSQNNNHLLSEAAGLITAGAALPEHPRTKAWTALGWKWFNRGLEKQIDGYGEYSQHSANYHRLMLQLALWVHQIGNPNGFTPLARKNAGRASHWLASMLDSQSGGVPNLGANDGAYILPLTVCPFADYRPVVQAAARVFLNYDLPRGVWDEMSLWLGIRPAGRTFEAGHYLADNLRGRESWAYLRATRFTSRPGHADLLHLDLWWRGLNVTRDAGTFSYNAAPPWDNPLTAARFHNTVTVDGRDQMTRASRFLYVDWAHAYARNEIDADEAVIGKKVSYHRAYRKLNILHQRAVSVYQDERWVVEDRLLAAQKKDAHVFTLHWLLPDWEWNFEELPEEVIANGRQGFDLNLKSPHGWLKARVHFDHNLAAALDGGVNIALVRAGTWLDGRQELTGMSPADELAGWVSPTYTVKEPALSLSVTLRSASGADFVTEFIFPK